MSRGEAKMSMRDTATKNPGPVKATDVRARTNSTYPTEELRSTVAGRSKRALGTIFGLKNFGVNHTTLEPGAASALQHQLKQDEFVYILQGAATLRLADQDIDIEAGACIGFPDGHGVGHCIVNRSMDPVVYLEIGDRTAGDEVDYPEVDLKAVDENGRVKFVRKDGSSY